MKNKKKIALIHLKSKGNYCTHNQHQIYETKKYIEMQENIELYGEGAHT